MVLIPSGFATTPAESWRIDPAHSHIRFTAAYDNDTMSGTFTKFDGTILFDPDRLDKSDVNITIWPGTMQTDNDRMQQMLPGPLWLAVMQFPTSTFTCTDIRHIKDQRYEARGMLTLKGVSAPMVLPFVLRRYEVAEDGHTLQATVEGTTYVSRLVYRVGEGEWAKPKPLAEKVEIVLHVEATKDLAKNDKLYLDK